MSAADLPFLDWPVETDEDTHAYCRRQVPGVAADHGWDNPCDGDLGMPGSPRELLQAIRRHAGEREHVGVTWRLEVWTDPHGERHWVPDIRQPRPEEIALAGITEGGDYWMTASGHPEATDPEGDPGAQHLRIVAEVKR